MSKRLNLRTIMVVALTAAAIAGVATTVANIYQVKATNEATQAAKDHAQAIAASDAIMASSAGLTRNVRYYVATGDKQYLDAYWKEINETKTQAKSLETLRGLNTREQDLALTQEASKNSAELVNAETRAMRLMLDAAGTPTAGMPAPVAAWKVSAEDAAVPKEQKQALAKQLVYGEAYDKEVAKIKAPLTKFAENLQVYFGDKMAEAKKRETASAVISQIAVLLLLGCAFAICFVFDRFVGRPIKSMTKQLAERDVHDLRFRLKPSGVSETHSLTDAFNRQTEQVSNLIRSVRQGAQGLAEASNGLSGVAVTLGGSAERTKDESERANQSASDVTRSVGSVSAATEEMGVSISEIAKTAADAATVAQSAVAATESTSATMAQLSESSRLIGEVVDAITNIASQTNLLALNATIESARAGEAGKGFAVVAHEVKELAAQTAKATEDIAGRVAAIQSDTDAAIEALDGITQIIQKINDGQTIIASAVEEQSATTRDISRSISEAADGVEHIAENINGVLHSAQGTNDGANETQASAEELQRLAQEFNELVGAFRTD